LKEARNLPLELRMQAVPIGARTVRACVFVLALGIPARSLAQDAQTTARDAWAALQAGDASRAAAIFRDELDRSPQNPTLYFGSAHASLALGRTDAAIASLKRAIEYNPRFLEAMILLAQVSYQSGDLDLALRTLERAAALAPRNQEIAAQLAEWRKESSLHQSFQTHAGIRFNILFEGPAQKALSDRVSALLENAYWNIGQALNIFPGEALTVILYSNRQFQDITRAPAWAGGGFDGRIRIPVSGALKAPQLLDRVVTHEYVHAVLRAAAPAGLPAWINEGLASHLESSDKSWAASVLRKADGRIPLEDLVEGFARFDGPTSTVAYAESQIAGQLLCERLGTTIGPFIQMLGNGHTVDQALSTHGVRPELFYAEWRRRVGIR
jgi:tetratricopeptide (TPR) repeat protein